MKDEMIERLAMSISKEKMIAREIGSLFNHLKNSDSAGERRMVSSQIAMLKNELRKTGNETIEILEKIMLFKPLNKDFQIVAAEPEDHMPLQRTRTQTSQQMPINNTAPMQGKGILKPDSLEKLTLSRMKKKEKKVLKTKERKPRKYVKLASRMFHEFSTKLINKGKFKDLSRDLIKANMEFVPAAYISVIFFTALLSFFVSIIIFLFFLFFNIVALPPFIVLAQESLSIRFLKV